MSLDLDNVELLFSQSRFFFLLGNELESGILNLIKRAKNEIILCSCEFNSRSDFLLSEVIYEKLKQGVKVSVYGNHKSQLSSFRNAFSSPNLELFSWEPPSPKSLFHIKAILVDATYVYIGSANLSQNGMTNSAEWGLTTNSPDIFNSLKSYLQLLKLNHHFEVVN